MYKHWPNTISQNREFLDAVPRRGGWGGAVRGQGKGKWGRPEGGDEEQRGCLVLQELSTRSLVVFVFRVIAAQGRQLVLVTS